jgi:hypothetical protein
MKRKTEEANSLSGDVDEFLHRVRKDNDNNSAIKKVEDAGFNAGEVNWPTINKKLGIPLITDVKELHGNSNFILFASLHDNGNEPEYLKYIIANALERSNKKIIVVYEADKSVYKLLNDPKKDVDSKVMQDYLANFSFRDIAKEVIKAFREIQQRYGTDRFEIVPIDLTMKEREDKVLLLQKRDSIIAKTALEMYETYKDNIVLVYAGVRHIIDILSIIIDRSYIMKMESVKKEAIKKDVSVFVPIENMERFALKLLNLLKSN